MALGATRESVYTLMLGTIVAPVLLGLALGCIASLSHRPQPPGPPLQHLTHRPVRHAPGSSPLRLRRRSRHSPPLPPRRKDRTHGSPTHRINNSRPAPKRRHLDRSDGQSYRPSRSGETPAFRFCFLPLPFGLAQGFSPGFHFESRTTLNPATKPNTYKPPTPHSH